LYRFQASEACSLTLNPGRRQLDSGASRQPIAGCRISRVSEPLTITGLLALYGAVLSSIALGWNLYRDLHDRAKLKLVAHLRRIAPSAVGQQRYAVAPDLPVAGRSDAVYIFLDVANVGRRPVKWNGWGGKYKERAASGKDSFVVIAIDLPKMLAEGESHSEFTDGLHTEIENVKKIFLWDASGRNWSLPRRELKKLKAEVRKHMARPNAAAAQ
jgi:hypothetical protein